MGVGSRRRSASHVASGTLRQRRRRPLYVHPTDVSDAAPPPPPPPPISGVAEPRQQPGALRRRLDALRLLEIFNSQRFVLAVQFIRQRQSLEALVDIFHRQYVNFSLTMKYANFWRFLKTPVVI